MTSFKFTTGPGGRKLTREELADRVIQAALDIKKAHPSTTKWSWGSISGLKFDDLRDR
jgi:hypothetical protein